METNNLQRDLLLRDDPAFSELINLFGAACSIAGFLLVVVSATVRRSDQPDEFSRQLRALRDKSLELRNALDLVILRLDRQSGDSLKLHDNPSNMSGTNAPISKADMLQLSRNQKAILAIHAEALEVIDALRQQLDQLNRPMADEIADTDVFAPYDELIAKAGVCSVVEFCENLRELLTNLADRSLDLSRSFGNA